MRWERGSGGESHEDSKTKTVAAAATIPDARAVGEVRAGGSPAGEERCAMTTSEIRWVTYIAVFVGVVLAALILAGLDGGR